MSAPDPTSAMSIRNGSVGVTAIDDIRARCWVDPDTNCWHWRGALSGGHPCMWLPSLRQTVRIATALCVLLTGKKPSKGVVWHSTCGDPGCCNPDHRNRRGTRSTQMLALQMQRTPLQRARQALGRRRASRFSEEVVADIRISDEPLKVVALRHGCSIGYASRVRRGEIRNPVAAPTSSVFSFGRRG